MSYDTIAKHFTGQTPATEVKCWCGIHLAVPASLYKTFDIENDRKPGSFTLWCPLGHSFTRGGLSSEAKRLKDELAREKHRTEQAQADAKHQRYLREHAERRVSAKKGQLTKLRKRIGNGTCPCCNRHFVNLQRHMQGQHPTWQPEADQSLSHPETTES